VPRLLDAFGDKLVAQISVGPGGYHTIALTSDKEVYTWGHNRVGQLGYSNSDVVPRNGEGAHFLPTPRAVPTMRGCEVGALLVASLRRSVCVCVVEGWRGRSC
jgi:alpha-tubulin suppressor-like RCC1 family protein